MPYLTDKEISELGKTGKILLVRNHKVYDVTKFSKSHPGKVSIEFKIVKFF